MAFWTNTGVGLGRDPKRGFRFRIQIASVGGNGTGSYMWWAKSVDKPSFEISSQEHDYLNHKFKFPGKTTWNPVSLKMVDPTDPDMAATFSDIITAAGYHPPSTADDMTSVSKMLANIAVGEVTIDQIDANGNAIETWVLYNAWISKVNYGALDYSSEDLTELEIEFVYDWASLTSGTTNGSTHNTQPGGLDANSATGGRNFWHAPGAGTDPNS